MAAKAAVQIMPRSDSEGNPGSVASPSHTKETEDLRQRTVEGFRSIGVIAVFMAGLQAQMLAISLPDNDDLSAKFINAFWLAAIFLDVSAVVLATLTARWFEVLQPEDVNFLNKTWVTSEKGIAAITLPPKKHWEGFIEYWVATSLFSGLGVLAAGVLMFFIGLMVLIWAKQPLLVSIIATIPFAVMVPLVGCLFIPQMKGKQHIIQLLARKKGDW